MILGLRGSGLDQRCFLGVWDQSFTVYSLNVGPVTPEVALVPPEPREKFSFRKPLFTLPRRILGSGFAFSHPGLYAIGARLISIAPYFALLA
jgi:hypothetical protein